MTLGQKIKELREGAGLAQVDFAKQIGVTRNAVSQWEHDKYAPDRKRLVKIANHLGVPLDHLASPDTEVRERILELATRMFDRVGFDEISTESICAAGDIPKLQFDQNFPSKDHLLYEVLRGFIERTFSEVRRNPPKYGSLAARLKQLLRILCLHDLSHSKLAASLHRHSWNWDDAREREHSRQMSEFHEIVYALLEEAEQQGQIDKGNFRAASVLIMSSYTYLLRKGLLEEYDPDKFISMMEPQIALILNGLGYRVVPGFADGLGSASKK